VQGVARVGVQGGRVEEYRVTVDPDKLQSFKMTVAEVASALSASNVLVAVGRLEQYDKLYLVVSDTRFKRFEEIEHTVLRSSPDGVVLLDDVATVEHSTEPQWVRVTADGHDAVLFQVYQQPSGNTVEIARGIKAKLREIGKQIPEGVKIASFTIHRVVSEMIAKSRPTAEARTNTHLVGHGFGVGKYLAKARKVAGRRPAAANARGAQKLRLAPE
jgi:multidrug efflux pump subunit AcrB